MKKLLLPFLIVTGIYATCLAQHTGTNNTPEEKRKQWREAIQRDSTEHHLKCTACTWYKIANSYIQQKEWGNALMALNSTLQADPKFRTAYIEAVEILLEQDRFKEAESYIARAKEYDAATGWYCQGLLAFKERQWSDAKEDFQTAINGDPSFGNPYMYLAAIAEAQSDNELAANYYRQTVMADPDYYDAYTSLGSYYAGEGRGDSVINLYTYGIQHARDTVTISTLHVLKAVEYLRQVKTAASLRDKELLEKKIFEAWETALALGYTDARKLLLRFRNYAQYSKIEAMVKNALQK